MPSQEEIKEAIRIGTEIVNSMQASENIIREFMPSEFNTATECQIAHANKSRILRYKNCLKTLVFFAQQALEIKEPQKKYADTPIKQEYCDEYNQALHDYRLWLAKKLMELERVIAEFMPHRDSEYIKPLAQAIKEMLGVKE